MVANKYLVFSFLLTFKKRSTNYAIFMMHMKRNTLIVYAVFLVFMLILIGTTFYFESIVEKGNFNKMIELAKNATLFKYLSFVGLILLAADFGMNYMTIRQLHKDKEAWQSEMTTLKAKLFDLQEAGKTVVAKSEKGEQ